VNLDTIITGGFVVVEHYFIVDTMDCLENQSKAENVDLKIKRLRAG
jgi:hypothetical protein